MNEALRNLNSEAQAAMDGSPPTVRDAAGYVHITFQCGPVLEHGVNGTSIENVITLLIERLEGFQRGPFASPHNAAAIRHLRGAITALEARTRDRCERGVEGTNQS